MLLSLRLLRVLRRSSLCSTYNYTVAPLSGKRFLSTAAQEAAIEKEGCDEEPVLSKRALMQAEGFTEPQIKAVLDHHPRSDKLAWLITILKDRGITGPVAGSFVSSRSRLLNKNLNQFFLCLSVFEDEGVSPALVKKAILQPSGYLSCASHKVEILQKHISFLKELGLSPHEIFLAMIRTPRILKLSIEKHLKPRFELFYRNGLSNVLICRALRKYPHMFLRTEANISQKLEVFKEFGLDVTTGVGIHTFALWTRYTAQKLRSKFEFLKSLGISREDAILLVQKQPWVLCMSDENLKKRMEFFLHSVKANVKDLLSSSCLFTCSLEKRVIPRLLIVLDLREKGLLKKPMRPASVVAISDARFVKRYNVDPRHLG